jgi:hypothetical protein
MIFFQQHWDHKSVNFSVFCLHVLSSFSILSEILYYEGDFSTSTIAWAISLKSEMY